MVQALVFIGALGAGGVYFMDNIQERNKLLRTSDVKMAQNLLRKELAEAMADTSICLKTFEAGAMGDLTSDLEVTAVKNDAGDEIYSTDSTVHDQKIKSFTLDLPSDFPGAYPTTGTLRIIPATFLTKVELDMKAPKTTYGGKDNVLKVPLRLLVLNNRIQTCISADSGSVLDAFIAACTNLQGNYNESTGNCENLHGNTSHVAVYLRDFFCSDSASSCSSHPYAGRLCSRSILVPSPTKPLPVDMEDNAVLRGFRQDGTPQCECAPRICPDPALFCSGTDLGHDWCYQDCPDGTKVCP